MFSDIHKTMTMMQRIMPGIEQPRDLLMVDPIRGTNRFVSFSTSTSFETTTVSFIVLSISLSSSLPIVRTTSPHNRSRIAIRFSYQTNINANQKVFFPSKDKIRSSSYSFFQTDFCTIQRLQYSPESRTLLSVSPSLRLEKGKLPEGFLGQPLNPLLRLDNPRTSLDLDSALCSAALLCTTSGCLCGFHTADKLILAWYLPSYCSSLHAIACG